MIILDLGQKLFWKLQGIFKNVGGQFQGYGCDIFSQNMKFKFSIYPNTLNHLFTTPLQIQSPLQKDHSLHEFSILKEREIIAL